MSDDGLTCENRSGEFGGRSRQADDLLEQIASCLGRVRDHIYGANVGGLMVEAGCDLFDLEGRCEAGPQVVRAVPSAADGPGGVT